MRNRLVVMFSLLVLVSLTGCQSAEAPAPETVEVQAPTDESVNVRESFKTLLRAYQVGSAEGVLSVLDTDVLWMPPDAASIQGLDAVMKHHQDLFAANTVGLSFSVQEVQTSGDWAFTRGQYSVSVTPKAGGNAMAEAGKAISVMKRDANGVWKFYRFIWNRNFSPEAR